jgi:tight adherence protein C
MDWKVEIVVVLTFLAVTGTIFGVGQYYAGRARVSRRLTVTGPQARSLTSSASGIGNLVTDTFTEDRFGVDSTMRQKLRKELLRAGYFGANAVRYYVFARYATVVLLPLSVYVIFLVAAPGLSWYLQFFVVSVAAGLAIILPDAYLSRRQGALMHQYRLIFPDLLDLLMVCMSAGLSIEAAISRVREHVDKRSTALALNLELLGAEMRAGRSTIEVLNALAERLGIDEAQSFVAVLRHSLELGGDVVDSLRMFSDEMRDKRVLRAEETANKLPVKIVLPLSLGIFPVILMIVMLPVVLKLLKIAHSV